MQTKMAAKYISISYVCPKCDFKFTLRGGVFDNCEFGDKILQKAESTEKECAMCKSILQIRSITCKVDPIINRNFYEIRWECKDCHTKWHSIHDIAPDTVNFSVKLARIRNMAVCINENCRSNNVKTMSFLYNRKT